MGQKPGGLWEYQRTLQSRGGERQAGRQFQYDGSYSRVSTEGYGHTHRCPRPNNEVGLGSLGEPLEKVPSQVREKV